MRAALVLMAAFGLVCSSVGCNRTSVSPSSRPSVIRVLTYNLNANAPLTAESIRAIRESNVDLVCLQEVRSDAEATLRREFVSDYPHVLARSTRGGWDGLAFFSKFPLREVQFSNPHAEGWFPSWLVELVLTEDSRVQVLQVHLRPRIDEGMGKALGPLIGNLTIGPKHRREIEAIASSLRTDRPAFIIGDFNERECGAAISYLAARGFKSALDEFDPTAKTWHGSHFGFQLAGRVDHILCSRDFRVAAARVIENDGSDHRPVFAEIEWCAQRGD